MRLGEAQNTQQFLRWDLEGITVFYDRRLLSGQAVTVGLTNYLLFKSLQVIDWKLI